MAELRYRRILFLIAPTGLFCREDRCQSAFSRALVPTMRPPMEECEAAGALAQTGAESFVIDGPAEALSSAAVLVRVQTIAPDLIVLVTSFGTLTGDLGWARRLRGEMPSAAIAIRGAPCYVMAEEILRCEPALDFCVRGEYEMVFEDVARNGFQVAAGTVFRRGDEIVVGPPAPIAEDLDALPWPQRAIIDQQRYTTRWLRAPQATVRVQRGCPFGCSYCLVPIVSGTEPRHRSPVSIAAEMAEVQRSGIDFFYLRADTFSVNRRWAIATCEAIGVRCPTARWVTTTRAECVDDEVLAAMRRAGCYGISFGIDAASREIGARVGKRPDLELAKAAMRACDRHGIVSLCYIMVGFLWDSPQTLAETAAFIHALKPDLITIHYAHPYPGTAYHQQAVSAGYTIGSQQAQSDPAFDLSGISAEDLRSWSRHIERRHYARPRVIASLFRKACRLVSQYLFDAWKRKWRVRRREFAQR